LAFLFRYPSVFSLLLPSLIPQCPSSRPYTPFNSEKKSYENHNHYNYKATYANGEEYTRLNAVKGIPADLFSNDGGHKLLRRIKRQVGRRLKQLRKKAFGGGKAKGRGKIPKGARREDTYYYGEEEEGDDTGAFLAGLALGALAASAAALLGAAAAGGVTTGTATTGTTFGTVTGGAALG